MPTSCYINDVKRSNFDRLCEPVDGVIGLLLSLIDKGENEILDVLANTAKITMLTCHDNLAGAKVNDETFFHLLAKYYERGFVIRLPLRAFIDVNAIDKQVLETIKHLHNAFTNNGEPKKYVELTENAKKFINRLKTERIDGEEILKFKRCSPNGDRYTILELAKNELPKAKKANDADNIERIEKYIKVVENWMELVEESSFLINEENGEAGSTKSSISGVTLETDSVLSGYSTESGNFEEKSFKLRVIEALLKKIKISQGQFWGENIENIGKYKYIIEHEANLEKFMQNIDSVDEIIKYRDSIEDNDENIQIKLKLTIIAYICGYALDNKEFCKKLKHKDAFVQRHLKTTITNLAFVTNKTLAKWLNNTWLGGKRKTKRHRRTTIRKKKRVSRRR